jgi:maleate isomerase
MVDSLGPRMKFGVVAPSTNTSVQPEMEGMRPYGVTNHFSRIVIPDTRITDNKSYMVMLNNIREATMEAVESVATCSPDHVIMAMSAEAFWDGKRGAATLQRTIEKHARTGVTLASTACREALKRYGKIRRIGVITPYMPIADIQVRRYFTDIGMDVVNLIGLRCPSPMLISHVSKAQLRDAIVKVNRGRVDAIVQVGTNLAMAELAGIAEFWLDKPVIAINTATYWYALRQNGIKDRVYGWGSLLADH